MILPCFHEFQYLRTLHLIQDSAKLIGVTCVIRDSNINSVNLPPKYRSFQHWNILDRKFFRNILETLCSPELGTGIHWRVFNRIILRRQLLHIILLWSFLRSFESFITKGKNSIFHLGFPQILPTRVNFRRNFPGNKIHNPTLVLCHEWEMMFTLVDNHSSRLDFTEGVTSCTRIKTNEFINISGNSLTNSSYNVGPAKESSVSLNDRYFISMFLERLNFLKCLTKRFSQLRTVRNQSLADIFVEFLFVILDRKLLLLYFFQIKRSTGSIS